MGIRINMMRIRTRSGYLDPHHPLRIRIPLFEDFFRIFFPFLVPLLIYLCFYRNIMLKIKNFDLVFHITSSSSCTRYLPLEGGRPDSNEIYVKNKKPLLFFHYITLFRKKKKKKKKS